MRKGLTLFEVILAIGLSALVLLMLASAINLHARMLDSRRRTVEDAQLARVLLRQFANDLRCAVYSENGGGSVATGSMSDDSSGATSSEGSASDDAETTSDDAVGGEIQSTAPGLYGTAYELRFEVIRPPLLDALTAEVVDAGRLAAQTAGGLQTVAYHLGSPGQFDLTMSSSTGTGTGIQSPSAGGPSGGSGLVRQVSDHAVVNWSVQNGVVMSSEGDGEVLAPEVIDLQFRYFDGMQWWDEWDSSVNGGLPLAVEIALVMATGDEGDESSAYGTSLAMTDMEACDNLYRMTVHLPAALPTYEEETTY